MRAKGGSLNSERCILGDKTQYSFCHESNDRMTLIISTTRYHTCKLPTFLLFWAVVQGFDQVLSMLEEVCGEGGPVGGHNALPLVAPSLLEAAEPQRCVRVSLQS